MKRHFHFALLPVVAALGACSSSSSPSGPQQNQASPEGGSGSSAGGGTGDDSSASGGGDDGGNPAVEYDAPLTHAQVVRATTSPATGTAKFFLQADGTTLNYDITQNVANAQAVNLHIGAPGENGAVAHQLTPVSGQMTGSITLSADEQAALPVDQLYLDVTSTAFPDGEIRGQLTLPGATIFVAVPTGAQEVPPINTQYAAHASFILSPDQGTILFHVVTTATPTNVLLQRSIGSLNGQIAYPLTPLGKTMDGTLQIGTNDSQDIQAARFYVNIQTAGNPAGELRGQLIAPGELLFTGVLGGTNEVPPVASSATGGTQFVLSADGTTLSYEAIVSGIIPTAMDLDNAPVGQNGSVMYQLTLDQQGALGQTTVTSNDTAALTASSTYVNVHTVSYAAGELRAQLVQQ
jgi:hypothetical protein